MEYKCEVCNDSNIELVDYQTFYDAVCLECHHKFTINKDHPNIIPHTIPTVEFSNKLIDTHNIYDSENESITAPVSGYYQIDSVIYLEKGTYLTIDTNLHKTFKRI